jgi:hypothetical protein
VKKKSILLPTLAACIAFTISCQQPVPEQLDPVTIANNRVKTYTETIANGSDQLSNTYNITYDDKGRVTALIDSVFSDNKFVYAYPAANRYTMDIYNFGDLSIHADFLLNAVLAIDSIISYNDTQDTTTEGFTYNATNQLMEHREYEYSKATGAVLFHKTNYTYGSDGNLTRSQESDGAVQEYQYYPNLTYIPPLTIGPITSASSKKVNLVKTVTATQNGSVERADYTYIFDDKDRISIEKVVFNSGGTITRKYTY